MSIVRHAVRQGLYCRETSPVAPRGTLLFVHGLGESGLCFEHLLDRKELREWRCLVPDLVGYGRTPRDGRPRGLADHVEDLIAWTDAIGTGPVIVVGHSMGGVIAVRLAETDPDRVLLVVDVDGNTSADSCVYSGRAAAVSLQEFTARGRSRMFDEIYRNGVDDPAQRGYYASLQLSCPATFHRNSIELVAESGIETLAARRAALTCPLVYLAGTPRGAGPRSRELLAAVGVNVVEISPSGHWPFIDCPESFLAALVNACERAVGDAD